MLPPTSERHSLVAQLVLDTSMLQIIIGVGTILTGICLYNVFLHPLAKYPGPLAARIGVPGSIWAFWHTYHSRYVWSLEQLHDRYGPVVRIGTNHLSFNSVEASQTMYAMGSSKKFPKTTFYKSFQTLPQHPSVFSERDPDRHSAFRRSISSAYSMNSLIKLEQYIEPLLAQLVRRLQAQSKTVDEPINLAKWLHFFAMDSVGELAFGMSFGFVDSGSDEERFLQGVSNLSHWGSVAGWLPGVSTLVRRFLRFSSGQPGGEVVGQKAAPLIERRFSLLDMQKNQARKRSEKDELDVAMLDDRQDMLASFVKSKNPQSGSLLTPIEVLRTAISVIGAGSDTTATALTAFVGHVVRDAEVYDRLQSEIDKAFDESQLTWPVQYAQAVQLPFLQACIKETLRLHPPIAMSLPRWINDAEGCVFRLNEKGTDSDKDVIVAPNGCQVSVSPYVLHRNVDVYGSDARQFNPSRWFDLSEEQRQSMERVNLTFGSGSRQCIGKNISLMEINKTIPTLFRTLQFRLPGSMPAGWIGTDSNGNRGHDIPWRCRSTWFLEVQEFPLHVTARPNVEMDDGQ